MPPLSSYQIVLGGIHLDVIPDPSSASGKPQDRAYDGVYLPQESNQRFVKRDAPSNHRRFDRGAGFLEERDENDDNGYAWGEDINMWSGNGITPSGLRTSSGANLGLAAASQVIGSVTFGPDMFVICSTKHCIKYTNCNPAGTVAYSPALNAFGDPTASFRSGFHPQAIAIFRDIGGNDAIMVSTYNSSSGETRMYTYSLVGGGTWVEGAVLGYRAAQMAVVWWEGRDGVGAKRLLISANAGVIRHCIIGADPTLTASYVTPIQVVDPGYGIMALVAAGGHAYAVSSGGIMDFNELRVWNLTEYWKEKGNASMFWAAAIYDDHIYAARGFGIDRYDLRQGEGIQQRIPGECGPGFGWQDGSPITGFSTAFAIHDGWFLDAVYNPDNLNSYVMRAKDRRVLNKDVQNPLVWHGAEQVLKGSDSLITHMRVTPDTTSLVGGNQRSRLWMFAAAPWHTSPTAVLHSAQLPAGAGSLSLQASGGSFVYAATSRVFFTARTWDDRMATKGIRRYDLVSRSVSASSTIQLKARADGAASTIADDTTYTNQGIHNDPLTNIKSITPTAAAVGQSIALLAILTTTSPNTATPILHEVSMRARVVREAFEVRRYWIVLERDHGLNHGQPDLADADTTFAAIVALANSAASATLVDERGSSYTVAVEQNLEFTRTEISTLYGGQYRTVVGCEISIIS